MQSLVGEIPFVNPNDAGNPKYDAILQQYGAADFRQVVQRGIEKDYIERTAALLSIAERSSIVKPINGLSTIMERSANGGVKAQFPIDGPTGGTGDDTNNGPLIPKTVVLDRANVTYRIMHEALVEGGEPAENDSIAEGVEQLGAKMDIHYLTELAGKAYSSNAVAASATWGTTGDVFDDINTAINNIISNSGISPNAITDNWFTVIVPISVRKAFQKISIVDGLKVGISDLIKQKLGAQVLYTRAPFSLHGETWPVTNRAIVIPTKDRHVGKFYTFNGGEMPSIFTTSDENGKRVSTNSWMKYAVTPSEADGSLTENRRIGLITAIA